MLLSGHLTLCMTILASTLRPRTFRHLSLDDYVKSANVGIAEAV
jgi:hypothetical protein